MFWFPQEAGLPASSFLFLISSEGAHLTLWLRLRTGLSCVPACLCFAATPSTHATELQQCPCLLSGTARRFSTPLYQLSVVWVRCLYPFRWLVFLESEAAKETNVNKDAKLRGSQPVEGVYLDISYRIVSYHIISYHITSHHIISYHDIYLPI